MYFIYYGPDGRAAKKEKTEMDKRNEAHALTDGAPEKVSGGAAAAGRSRR